MVQLAMDNRRSIQDTKKGFNIKVSELESGRSIKKLCLLMLDAIIKIFQMCIAWDEPKDAGIQAGVCLTALEIECADMQCKKIEGNGKIKEPLQKRS